jgi:hypothetical protein
MKVSTIQVFMLGSLLFSGACATAPKPLYQWGDYQNALLSYTKNPQETSKFADRLKRTIDKAEVKDGVPPGLYAEYGYALIELNQPSEAIAFFGRERKKWPESAALMNKLIDRLTKAGPSSVASPVQAIPSDGRLAEPPVPSPVIPATNPTNG